MRYNGTDLSGTFKVTHYEGISAPSLKTTLWSPTLGNGDRIAIARQPNRTVTATCVIEAVDASDMANKIKTLHTVFTSGRSFVNILFDEVDTLTYRGRVTSVKQTAYYFTVAEYKITFTCRPFRYGSQKTVTATGTTITGTNAGTAPNRGVLSFTISNDPAYLTIQLTGGGAIQLLQPSDDSLDGAWTIDLDARTVYRNGDLAMEMLSFENTTFETFEVPAGSFTITFSSAISNASYVYTEVYL